MKKLFYGLLAATIIIVIICGAFAAFGKNSYSDESSIDIPRVSSINPLVLIDIATGRLRLVTNPSGSMEDTILTGDKLFFDTKAYAVKEPERFDVVIFNDPDGRGVSFVKRIIGLPGETIEIRAGQVYINGGEFPLDEPYVKGGAEEDFELYEIDENGYFLMGDNRAHSYDSRIWENKCVPAEDIFGKAVFIIEQ